MPVLEMIAPLLFSVPFAAPVENNAWVLGTLMVPVTVQSPELQVT